MVLEQKGFDIFTIRKEARGISDQEIIEISRKFNRIIISFDKDFGELIYRFKSKPYGVILLRLVNHNPQYILNSLNIFFKRVEESKILLAHHFIVFNLYTIRVKTI